MLRSLFEETIKHLIDTAFSKNIEDLPLRQITRKNGQPYLDRYYLFGAEPKYFPVPVKPIMGFLPFTVFLHHFRASDEEKACHNHPWDESRSLILVGGYHEERLVTNPDGSLTRHFKQFWPGDINTIRSSDFHRVDLITPDVWTLFVTGKKSSTWGFKDPLTGVFEHWKTFVERGRRVPNLILKVLHKNDLKTLREDLSPELLASANEVMEQNDNG